MWEIVWNDPSTGRIKRQSCKTRDEHEADRKLAEKVLSGDVVPPNVVTIGYLVDRYYQHLKRRKEAATIVPMASKVERLKDFLGTRRWQDFGQADVENYIDHAKTVTRWDRGGAQLSDGVSRSGTSYLTRGLTGWMTPRCEKSLHAVKTTKKGNTSTRSCFWHWLQARAKKRSFSFVGIKSTFRVATLKSTQ